MDSKAAVSLFTIIQLNGGVFQSSDLFKPPMLSRLRPFHWLCIVVLIIGISFRVTHLDRKVYWHDEAFTLLYISGYNQDDVADDVGDRVVPIGDLQKYQRPDSSTPIISTPQSLLKYDSSHVPLYYTLARIWSQFTGGDPVAVRQVAVFFSLLSLPCIYWFCYELFASHNAAWLGTAMMAIAPYQLIYAQEGREYGLWILTICATSALLLRVLREPSRRNWGFYIAGVALSSYAYFLNVTVFFAQGIYVWGLANFRFTTRVWQWCGAVLLGLLPFGYWLWKMQDFNVISWTARPLDRFLLLKIWAINAARSFVDGEFTLRNPLTYAAGLMLLLIAYALYFMLRSAPKRVWLLIFVLIGCTAFPFGSADFLSGGRRTAIFRFVMPTYLGLQLAVVYLFSVKLWSDKLWAEVSHRFDAWRLGLVCVLTIGILSCWQIQQSAFWWHKYDGKDTIAIAKVLNRTDQPLLIANMSYEGRTCYSCRTFGFLLAISHSVDPAMPLNVLIESPLPQPHSTALNYFVLNPSRSWRNTLSKAGYTLQASYKGADQSLWMLGFPPQS